MAWTPISFAEIGKTNPFLFFFRKIVLCELSQVRAATLEFLKIPRADWSAGNHAMMAIVQAARYDNMSDHVLAK